MQRALGGGSPMFTVICGLVPCGGSSVVARVDPGWMYLCAGSAIVVAGVLIPANHDLAESRALRDRAIVSADYAAGGWRRTPDFLESLDSGDETVMTNLAATQLNTVPATKAIVHAAVVAAG
ncbi:MAG: hypothetical protein R3B46_14335 [Phycisphaerales bacterium]